MTQTRFPETVVIARNIHQRRKKTAKSREDIQLKLHPWDRDYEAYSRMRGRKDCHQNGKNVGECAWERQIAEISMLDVPHRVTRPIADFRR